MNSSDTFRVTPRLIIGFGILTLGLLWTLDNLDILESEPITRWWPVVLILLGAVQLLDRRTNKGGPVVLMVVGSLLLLRQLGWSNLDFADLIPLGIALLGAKLIWDALARRSARSGSTDDPDSEIHAFAMMGGVKRQSTSREFRGGDANAVMGGVELDLRNAHVDDGEEVILDAFAMWGAVEIFVPPHWRVKGNVLPIMGAFVDKTRPSMATTGPVLQVRGTAVMGGIEVKN